MPYIVLDPSTAAAAPATTAGAPLANNGETFKNIQDEIALSLGNRVDITGTYIINLKRWINWGYRHICSMIDTKEMWSSVAFPLVTDQPFYLVPASLAWVKRFVLQDDDDYADDGGIELTQIDEATYRQLPESDTIQISGSVTPPRKYFRYNRMLVVWPTPATDYTSVADFRVRPTDLVLDNDCPILRPEFSEVIMLAGLMRTQQRLNLKQQAAITQNEMLSVLRPIINTDAEETVAMRMAAQPAQRMSNLYRARLD